MTLRIGICGPRGSGKTTAGDMALKIVSDMLPHASVVALHNLHSMYEAVALWLGIPRAALEDAHTKDEPWTAANAPVPCLAGLKPRNIMDAAGAFGRGLAPQLFVELWAKQAGRYDIAVNLAIRFDAEAAICDRVIELRMPGKDYDPHSIYERGISRRWITDTVNAIPGAPFDTADTLAAIIITHYGHRE